MLQQRRRRAPGRRADAQHPVQPRPHDPAQDAEPEALRRRDRPAHDRLRHRPGRHRQDLPGDGQGGAGAAGQAGQPDHPDPPGGRGGGAARLPARHPLREDRPLPAAALRRAARHDRPRVDPAADGAPAPSRSRRWRTCGAARSRSTPGADAGRLPADRRRSQVGDLVVGSDGQPTPVLGVYPQGEKEVYRVTTQDGASTLALRRAPVDRRDAGRSTPREAGRVLETQEMVGNLRRGRTRTATSCRCVARRSSSSRSDGPDGPLRARACCSATAASPRRRRRASRPRIRNSPRRSRPRCRASSVAAQGRARLRPAPRRRRPRRRASSRTR